MLDPFPPPPRWLQAYTKPLAESLSLPVLPLHIHEVLFFFGFYQVLQSFISPWFANRYFRTTYSKFPRRTKLNWDIHVVSLVQSTLVTVTALWVMFVDEERKSMTSGERVYGYTGASGLVQAMATGYFLWDLIVSTLHIRLFGIGLFFHAVSALAVYSLGFRPFVNFYSPTFILYELSSPFLNFHWFFDKLNMTGSRAQWYNGMLLLSVFFGCRLVWGTWQSVRVFVDVFKVLWRSRIAVDDPYLFQTEIFGGRNATRCLDDVRCFQAVTEVSRFAEDNTRTSLPVWLVIAYLASNVTLNSLNFYWFSKMIDAVMKRFKDVPAKPTKETIEAVSKKWEDEGEEIVLEAAKTLEQEGNVGMKESSDDEKPQVEVTSQADPPPAPGVRRRKA